MSISSRKRSRSPEGEAGMERKRLRFSPVIESRSLLPSMAPAQGTLSEEIFLNVLSFLTPSELVRMELVCKDWQRMSTDAQLWKRLYLSRHPPPYTWPLAPLPPSSTFQSTSASTAASSTHLSNVPPSSSLVAPNLHDFSSPASSPQPNPGSEMDGPLTPHEPLHPVPKGIDWKMLSKISSNWHHGNASQRTLAPGSQPPPVAAATGNGSSLPIPGPSRQIHSFETRESTPEHIIALSPSHIFTAYPSSPFVHVHLSSEANELAAPEQTEQPQQVSTLIPPPPGWSSPSRPDAVTAICVDQSNHSIVNPESTARLAIFYRSGGYAIVQLEVQRKPQPQAIDCKGKGKDSVPRIDLCSSWSRILSYLPPNALRRRHRRRYHNVALEDEVTLAALSWPILMACTKKFYLSTYQLPPLHTSGLASDPVLVQTLHSPVSYHPATLSLLPLPAGDPANSDVFSLDGLDDPPNAVIYRGALAYCTPLYPESWTVAVQEIDVTLPSGPSGVVHAQVERGRCWSVGRTVLPGEGIRRWPFRARGEVIGVKGEKAVGVGVDGKWCVLAGRDNQIQVYTLPPGRSLDSFALNEVSSGASGQAIPAIKHSHTLAAHSSTVTSISLAGGLSPGRLLSAGTDGRVLVWELEEMEREQERLRLEEAEQMDKLYARARGELKGDEYVEVKVGGRRRQGTPADSSALTTTADGDIMKAIRKQVLPLPPSTHPLSLAAAAKEYFFSRPVSPDSREGATATTSVTIKRLAFNHDTIAGLVETEEALPPHVDGREVAGNTFVRVWKFD